MDNPTLLVPVAALGLLGLAWFRAWIRNHRTCYRCMASFWGPHGIERKTWVDNGGGNSSHEPVPFCPDCAEVIKFREATQDE